MKVSLALSMLFLVLSGGNLLWAEAPTGSLVGRVVVTGSSTPDQIVERLNVELRGKGPHEIIRVALREFGRKLTYVSSFGAESAAMLGQAFGANVDAFKLMNEQTEYRRLVEVKLNAMGVNTGAEIGAK